MADVDLYRGGIAPSHRTACNHEDQVLHSWERDILRAAHFRARNRGHDDATADELAQAARLRVWSLVRKGNTQPDSHYLRKVIANAVRTPLTSDPVLEAASEVNEDDVVDGSLQESDPLAVDAVRKWLVTLPAVLQRVYHFIFVMGYSQREAALVLGVSQPRIAQLHRALLERGSRDLRKFTA